MQFTKTLCINRQFSNGALISSHINKTKSNNLFSHSENTNFLTKFNVKIKKDLLKRFNLKALNYYSTNLLKPSLQTILAYRTFQSTNLTNTLAKVNDQILFEKRVPFEIPRLLDASTMETVPTIRHMLVKHAQDTYKGIGKTEFDSNDERTVAEGSDTAVIPLSTNELLQLYYMTHKKTVRYGMLIEQLDMFATWIGYKHNQNPNVKMTTPSHHTIGVVTAFVDSIEVHENEEPPAYNHDVFFHGYTSWVGKSSSEVMIHVQQKYSENDIRELLTAKFVMVVLDVNGKAAPNVKLALKTEDELKRFRKAESAKKVRSQIKKNSLSTNIPTADEVKILHDLNSQITDSNSFTLRPSRLQKNKMDFVLMDDSRYERSLICFPFQRNLHNKMFGGYLMRKAYETAFNNASMFSQATPKFVFGGEIEFYKPVPIGSHFWTKSQVCYTKNNYMQITISGEVLNNETNEFETCNSYQYTFKVDNMNLPKLIPTTYTDAMRYLTARRHFKTFVEKQII